MEGILDEKQKLEKKTLNFLKKRKTSSTDINVTILFENPFNRPFFVNNYTNIDLFYRMCFYFIFPTVDGLGGDGQSVRLDSGLEAQAMLNHTHTHKTADIVFTNFTNMKKHKCTDANTPITVASRTKLSSTTQAKTHIRRTL